MKKHDAIHLESLFPKAKAVLHALLTATDKQVDRALRDKLRMYARMAMEGGYTLHLSEPRTELGALMSKANLRSASMGFL